MYDGTSIWCCRFEMFTHRTVTAEIDYVCPASNSTNHFLMFLACKYICCAKNRCFYTINKCFVSGVHSGSYLSASILAFHPASYPKNVYIFFTGFITVHNTHEYRLHGEGRLNFIPWQWFFHKLFLFFGTF